MVSCLKKDFQLIEFSSPDCRFVGWWTKKICQNALRLWKNISRFRTVFKVQRTYPPSEASEYLRDAVGIASNLIVQWLQKVDVCRMIFLNKQFSFRSKYFRGSSLSRWHNIKSDKKVDVCDESTGGRKWRHKADNVNQNKEPCSA